MVCYFSWLICRILSQRLRNLDINVLCKLLICGQWMNRALLRHFLPSLTNLGKKGKAQLKNGMKHFVEEKSSLPCFGNLSGVFVPSGMVLDLKKRLILLKGSGGRKQASRSPAWRSPWTTLWAGFSGVVALSRYATVSVQGPVDRSLERLLGIYLNWWDHY